MKSTWFTSVFAFLFSSLLLFSSQAFAAKPIRPAAVPAPEVYSVKIDYTGAMIIVAGQNLDPASASGTMAGVALSVDGASTDTTLLFPFSDELAAVVNGLGNYVITVSNSGGSFTLTAFIPFALVTTPPPPPPPGEDCPCSPEWDTVTGTAPPNGTDGLTPYCSQDSGDFVTVQFFDQPSNNYWVMWTQWTGSTGYCELYIDGPSRDITTQDQFDACAGYLRNIVTVWGDQGNTCLF